MIRFLAVAAILTALIPDDPSPSDATLGAKPPTGAKVLFAGTDLDSWTTRKGGDAPWPVGDGFFAVGPGTGDIFTKNKFGSFVMHVEFSTPLMPQAKGQARGNSGVYLDGIYELQVLDSFGLTPKNNDCGAIYQQVAPKVNACKPPLQWQTYDVTFTKAKGDGAKARVTIKHNGIITIDDAEIVPTPGGLDNKAGEDGPILLQDHGNDVQFRNIWIVPKVG